MADRGTVQEIKEKLSILEVVKPYVKLVRAGKHWRGLSPFSKEKTPSFFVSPERGTYYCFSSGQGGDVFTFVEKMEGVDFKGALKILAEKAGIEVRYEKGGNANRSYTDRLREALASAENFFVQQMTPESSAYIYAKSRGLTDDTISAWRLGRAPEGWRTLLEALSSKGFTTKELIDAGLIKEAQGKQGTYYDRFRDRLIFPIRDSAGRTVAFTGRALSPDETAKYLNSPETTLFKKSETIFGMSDAKNAIRTRGFVLLVEGQMDVLHCHQIGFTNAVALSGTALSEHHLMLMKRYADNLMLILDADRAGLAATARSAILALGLDFRVKAVVLPDGQDPADLISQDASAFTERVTKAQSVIEFFLGVLVTQEKDMQRLVRAVETTVLPLVASVKSPLEREHFVGIVARALAITPESVRATLSRNRTVTTHNNDTKASRQASAQEEKPSVADLRAQALAAAAASYPESELAQRIQSEYARIIGAPLGEPSQRALFEVEIEFEDNPPENAADDLIRAFELSVLNEQYAVALAALRKAQVAGDKDAENVAESSCGELLKKIAACS